MPNRPDGWFRPPAVRQAPLQDFGSRGIRQVSNIDYHRMGPPPFQPLHQIWMKTLRIRCSKELLLGAGKVAVLGTGILADVAAHTADTERDPFLLRNGLPGIRKNLIVNGKALGDIQDICRGEGSRQVGGLAGRAVAAVRFGL